MDVGDIRIDPVLDGVITASPEDVLRKPGIEDAWGAHRDLLTADGRLEMAVGGFLVRSGDRVVLVDAGLGPFDRDDYRAGQLLDSLAALGVAPDDVTDVLLTHLHFDHVGWATQQGTVVFPNAVHRVHEADWAWFVTRPEAVPGGVRKLSPLAGHVETFAGECAIAPGVTARPVPGHTPGSTVFELASGGQRALLLGDVVHSVVELLEPGWEFAFDTDRAAAAAVRERISAELRQTGDPAAAAHFPGLAFGRFAGDEWVFL